MSKHPYLYRNQNAPHIVIAHRGASHYHPENTLSAFSNAISMKADMLELDVSLSKDGVPVVIHDNTLDRTTDGSGMVNNYDLSELKKLDAGKWFDPAYEGETIPTLEEVLKMSRGKIALNIEFKPLEKGEYPDIKVVPTVLKLVKDYGMEEHVIFSSFDYRILTRIRELDVDIYTALLYEVRQSKGRSPSELVNDYRMNAFNCSYGEYSEKWAEELRSNQIPVFVYYLEEERNLKKTLERGATGIFSNKPDVLRKIVDNMWKTK